MTIGEKGRRGVRTPAKADAQAILDAFYAFGGRELDTARVYAEGTTEAHLASMELHGCAIDSKAHPYEAGAHGAQKLRQSVETTLAMLHVPRVRTLYLHWPDRATPFIETLQALDTLHREGKFERLGLSNFAAWEVAECVVTARDNGWVVPSVYQAMYNGITRAIEEELVPCLRKYGMRIVVYNPLAGGLLTGKLTRESADSTIEHGSRFDKSTRVGQMYQQRYFRDAYFDAIDASKKAADKHGLTLAEVALRWVQHHSALSETDGVIIGASSLAHVRDARLWRCYVFFANRMPTMSAILPFRSSSPTAKIGEECWTHSNILQIAKH